MTQPVTPVQQNLQLATLASWSMIFPFQPYNGGEGVSLAATTSSSRVKLVGEYGAADDRRANIAVIFNTGTVFAFVRMEAVATGGSPSVVATTGSMAVPPGGALTITLAGATNAMDIWLNAITASSSATLQVTTGFGN